MRLDPKDRRVLVELDRNSRESVTVLARRLRMPVETVRYRVQNLVSSGVIQNFLTVIDGGRLGFYYYKIFFKFHNVSEANVNEVARYLFGRSGITWIVRVDGPFDIGFTVNVRNPVELSALIDEIRVLFSRFIRNWVYSVNIRMDFLTRDYLIQSARRKTAAGSYSAFNEPYKLDETNWKILRRLSESSRLTATAIAAGVGLTPEAVMLRLKKLAQDRVIVRYTLVLNNQLIGQLNYYVLIYLNSVTPEREQAFVDYCKSKPNIVYLIKALGEWDYEISLEVETVDQYRELMMDLTKEFSEIIRDYIGLLVTRIESYVYP